MNSEEENLELVYYRIKHTMKIEEVFASAPGTEIVRNHHPIAIQLKTLLNSNEQIIYLSVRHASEAPESSWCAHYCIYFSSSLVVPMRVKQSMIIIVGGVAWFCLLCDFF